ERLLRRAHVDGLPVAVQHQHSRFRQYVHKFADNHRPGRLGVCSLLKSARIKLAATAGNAPALPVSETGVQTSTLSGKMVDREGSAPPISGCRPDVILFHHRAEIGCRGWTRYVFQNIRLAPPSSPSKGGVVLIR